MHRTVPLHRTAALHRSPHRTEVHQCTSAPLASRSQRGTGGMSAEELSVRWEDFPANIARTFAELREGDELSDISLVTGQGRVVGAHKLVLAAASPFFQVLQALLRLSSSSPPPLLLFLSSSSPPPLLLPPPGDPEARPAPPPPHLPDGGEGGRPGAHPRLRLQGPGDHPPPRHSLTSPPTPPPPPPSLLPPPPPTPR